MAAQLDPSMVTSALELPGYRIVRNFGIVRGIIVRSRSVVGNIGAALQTIVGGNITILTDLCEEPVKKRMSSCFSTLRCMARMPSWVFAMTRPRSCRE